MSEAENSAAPEGSYNGNDVARLRRITLIATLFSTVVFFYFVIADRTTPFSPDARVQAFLLRVTPEVTGQVKTMGVTDNAVVEQGEVLFTINPTPFMLSVDKAQAQLKQAGQTIGASTAAVDVAQANLDKTLAAEQNVRTQSARVLDLVKRGVYPAARKDQAIANIETAHATVESAKADLRRAKEELGPKGQDNPKVQDAIAALANARFDLSRTTIMAPSKGVVSNLQLAVGQTVVAGQPAMTFISATDIWLLASIRENSLDVIKKGQSAEVVLDVLPGRVYQATVTSKGWGIASTSVDQVSGLPKSTKEASWLTDAERFPIQLAFDRENLPRGARYGSRASVIIYSGDSVIMDAIGWARIRLIAILTYVS